MLNAAWLETFVTLCEVGHFTRAAAALNMTQPGVSQHIRKLEAQVGQPLLSRDGKSFTLTPAGDAVLAVGRRRRDEDRDLRQSLRVDDPDSGHVALSCSGSIALLLYPLFMDLMGAAPALGLTLEAAPEGRIVEGVLAGRVDLGIISHPPAHPRLEGEVVGQDELCLILPGDGHRPSDLIGDLIGDLNGDFAALDALGFIAHPDGYAHADELLGANFPDDYPGADKLRQRSFVNQIGQIPDPVVRGLGYTILPRSGVDAYPGRVGLRIADLPRSVRHDLWLIQRKGRVLAARTRRVRDEVVRLLSAL